VAFGLLRSRSYSPAVLAVLAAFFSLYVSDLRWRELGLADQWMNHGLWYLFVDFDIAYAAYGIALLVAAVFRAVQRGQR
jgi:hypothetical protein